MATIQQEIMSIAEAQGYEGKSSGTIAEAVNALGSVMGDYELPVATSTTLGGVKVGDGLSVTNDGTLSASGGGSEPLIVHFTRQDSSYVADKTFDEVGEAVVAGRLVFAVIASFYEGINGEAKILPLTYYGYIGGESQWATFLSINYNPNASIMVVTIVHYYSYGTITMTTKNISAS